MSGLLECSSTRAGRPFLGRCLAPVHFILLVVASFLFFVLFFAASREVVFRSIVSRNRMIADSFTLHSFPTFIPLIRPSQSIR